MEKAKTMNFVWYKVARHSSLRALCRALCRAMCRGNRLIFKMNLPKWHAARQKSQKLCAHAHIRACTRAQSFYNITYSSVPVSKKGNSISELGWHRARHST